MGTYNTLNDQWQGMFTWMFIRIVMHYLAQKCAFCTLSLLFLLFSVGGSAIVRLW